MSRAAARYELFEHTADVGVVVRGESAAALFENAASAMFDVMAPFDRLVEPDEPGKALRVEVTAPDQEALLVAWLAELLSLAMAEGVIFTRFAVDAWDEQHVAGRTWGIAAREEDFETEIKAVTYHALEVAREGDAWRAQVLFDL